MNSSPSPKGKGEQTKQHLLDAAQKLFAEHGFRKTSVRDIAKEAGSNVAAVNYHFGSKENLYHEVFLSHKKKAAGTWCAAVRDILEESQGSTKTRDRSGNFRSGFPEGTGIERYASLENAHRARARRAPSRPRFVLEEVLAPIQQALSKAIDAACPGVPPKAVHRCVHSFLGTARPLASFRALLREQ